MIRHLRLISSLLCVLLLFGGFSACMMMPQVGPLLTGPEPAALTTQTETAPPPTETAPPPTETRAKNGASFRELFYDKSLPEQDVLEENQAAFYRQEADGSSSVTVMGLEELEQRLDALGHPPRTAYFESLMDVRFRPFFRVYDMAMELGSLRFAFSTRELSSYDLSSIHRELSYTYRMSDSRPQINSTKEYTDEAGEHFHFLSVALNHCEQTDLDRHVQALAKARQILGGMPAGMSELGTARWIYEYLAKNISYDYDDYYDDKDWNALYDALIQGSAVCGGFAEALCCLYNLAGIDCIFISGFVYDYEAGTLTRHAWNTAQVNGGWYLFDATWDDTSYDSGWSQPLFFGLSTEVLNYYARRDIDVLLAPMLPACDEILAPGFLAYIPDHILYERPDTP